MQRIPSAHKGFEERFLLVTVDTYHATRAYTLDITRVSCIIIYPVKESHKPIQ